MNDHDRAELERTIGSLTLAHGQAELMLSAVAWVLIDSTDEVHHAITGKLQTGQLCQLVRRLADTIESEPLRGRVKSAAKTLEKQSDKRNSFIHATPLRGEVVHVRSMLESIVTGGQLETIDPAKATKLTAQLQATAVRLQGVAQELRGIRILE